MNSQTQIAFKIFKESVGAPDWANTDGRESAIREWEESLGRYSDEQVKKACLKCIKYNHLKKFPALALVEAELVDEEYNSNDKDKKELANKAYIYMQAHKLECDPVPDDLTIKQVVWRSYGVAVDGYDPKRDGELE